jgi:NADH-quinone oxidoreductase subunit N
MELFPLIIPELILLGTALVLYLLGMTSKPQVRTAVPWIALLATLAAAFVQFNAIQMPIPRSLHDIAQTIRISDFAQFIKFLVAAVGALLILLSFPSNRYATGNSALSYDFDAAEYFSLVLCALAGVMLVAGSNDMLLMFMGIELASIPTYILVSISRPLPAAQEAGVKYFFLGAMAAAILLFGFSYLYGTTGTSDLHAVASIFAATLTTENRIADVNTWQMLAFVMLFVGLAFKLAAVPTHFYAGDVYQGAATPITALLSFVPKVTGIVAFIKLIWVAGGGVGAVPMPLHDLLWWLAVLTMTIGNVLGLMQYNVKRVLAYSSIAHSGYLLVGLAVFAYAPAGRGAGLSPFQLDALQGVLFYLFAYGLMNVGAFGVLMLLPTRARILSPDRVEVAPPATSAETFEDLRGTGRRHPALGLAMAVCCFSLIGLPLTIGFLGKLYLIMPALDGGLYTLVVITVINAAISAGYYLRIIGTMFLAADDDLVDDTPAHQSMPITIAIAISVAGTILFGAFPQAVGMLGNQTSTATVIDTDSTLPAPTFEGDDDADASAALNAER